MQECFCITATNLLLAITSHMTKPNTMGWKQTLWHWKVVSGKKWKTLNTTKLSLPCKGTCCSDSKKALSKEQCCIEGKNSVLVTESINSENYDWNHEAVLHFVCALQAGLYRSLEIPNAHMNSAYVTQDTTVTYCITGLTPSLFGTSPQFLSTQIAKYIVPSIRFYKKWLREEVAQRRVLKNLPGW